MWFIMFFNDCLGLLNKKKGSVEKFNVLYKNPTTPRASNTHLWMRYGISAFSILLSKQEQFALFKLPWLVALIESLRLDSRPSRQLKRGLQQMYACRWRSKMHIFMLFEIYEYSIYTRTACWTWKFDSSNSKSTSWAQGEFCTRCRLHPLQYCDLIAWAMME